jgi:hypothetical protein
MAVNTGLRENELFSLKPAQIDFHRDVITVRETKAGEDRYVPMNDVVRGLLRRLVTSAKHASDTYILTNPKTGNKYTTIKTAWLTACRLAGIEDLNFHDLRHTFGTRAIDNGAPLPADQEVMGHKSIETTRGYTRATEEGKRRVVEARWQSSGASGPNSVPIGKSDDWPSGELKDREEQIVNVHKLSIAVGGYGFDHLGAAPIKATPPTRVSSWAALIAPVLKAAQPVGFAFLRISPHCEL